MCGTSADLPHDITKTSNAAPKSTQNVSEKKGPSNAAKLSVTAGIVVVGLILFLVLVIVSGKTSQLQITDVNMDTTTGFFSTDYVISGKVVNSGSGTTNQIILRFTVLDSNGNTLLSAQTSTQPSILGPGEQATFSKHFTSENLGGYTGAFTYETKIVSS